jgi:UDP-N-acetylglucosamine pyrophosphorylase
MPRILLDPNLNHCPDYSLGVFEQTCTTLVNATTTHDQVTAFLTNIWNATNAAEKLIWQAQVEADIDLAQAAHLQEEEDHLL